MDSGSFNSVTLLAKPSAAKGLQWNKLTPRVLVGESIIPIAFPACSLEIGLLDKFSKTNKTKYDRGGPYTPLADVINFSWTSLLLNPYKDLEILSNPTLQETATNLSALHTKGEQQASPYPGVQVDF